MNRGELRPVYNEEDVRYFGSLRGMKRMYATSIHWGDEEDVTYSGWLRGMLLEVVACRDNALSAVKTFH